jgi:molybdenum cofactor synthesis domain-containing protein
MTQREVKAAVLLIGDELLSGRTQDVNLQTIAKFLAPLGVRVAEARVVADAPEEIVAAVNALRAKYDYVFTTGGIGPTHDDKTADAVAAAFGVHIGVRDDARAILEAHYKSASDLNEARLRMARIPDGASLIANPVSKAPGFQLGNVFVMAGVPSIMRGMLQDVGRRIQGGAVVRSFTVRGRGVREGDIAAGLEALEQAAPGVSFGSYPWFTPEGYGLHLVARSADPGALAKAGEDLKSLIRSSGTEPEVVEESPDGDPAPAR